MNNWFIWRNILYLYFGCEHAVGGILDSFFSKVKCRSIVIEFKITWWRIANRLRWLIDYYFGRSWFDINVYERTRGGVGCDIEIVGNAPRKDCRSICEESTQKGRRSWLVDWETCFCGDESVCSVVFVDFIGKIGNALTRVDLWIANRRKFDWMPRIRWDLYRYSFRCEVNAVIFHDRKEGRVSRRDEAYILQGRSLFV